MNTTIRDAALWKLFDGKNYHLLSAATGLREIDIRSIVDRRGQPEPTKDNLYGTDPGVPKAIDQARVFIALSLLRVLFPRRMRSVRGATLLLYPRTSSGAPSDPQTRQDQPGHQGIHLIPGHSTQLDELLVPARAS